MPDLGTYAVPVLSSYAVSLSILLGIIVLSIVQARRARRRLQAIEQRLQSSEQGPAHHQSVEHQSGS